MSVDQYFPNDSVSESLVASIPRKVVTWLRDLEARYNVKLLAEGSDGQLTFERGRDIALIIAPDSSTMMHGWHENENEEGYLQLWWDGHWDNPTNVRVSDLTLVEAKTHIEDFIVAEKKFYDTLTALQKELEEKAPTPKMPKKYEREV